MESSPDVNRLIKRLYVHLSDSVGRDRARLRNLGWTDFRVEDKPEVIDALTLAQAAFLYLSINDEGNWNAATDVLSGLIAFLTEATGRTVRVIDLEKLKAILQQKPVKADDVRDWFEFVYG